MALDERLRGDLEGAAQPADPSGIYEHLIRRRERRQIARKVQAGALAMAVIAGSIAGVVGLSAVFRMDSSRVGGEFPVEGAIVFLVVGEREDILYHATPDGGPLEEIASFGHATYASVSPAGGRIAYVLVGEGNRGLWVADTNGANPVRLTEATPNNDFDPVWSPDGSQILFVRNTVGHGELFVIAADGSGLTQLTRNDVGQDFMPAWSPDGSHIVFGRNSGGPTDLYVTSADGSDVRRLTDFGIEYQDAAVGHPAWSPDGSRITFAVEQGDRIPSGDIFVRIPSGDIFVMNADGTHVIRLTDVAADDTRPVWSPDGSWILFLSNRLHVPAGEAEVTEAYDLFVMRRNGSDVTRVPLGEPIREMVTSLAWLGGFEPSPTVEPSPDVEPTESPEPVVGEDIGIGFPVCDVTSVSGVFALGVDGTAFVGTKAGNTGDCPDFGRGFQLVAVDISGDGLADASYGPLECDDWCSAFAAPDVDGDGSDELLIQNIQFSIAGLRLYEVRADPAEVFPVTVATPGYPEGGLDPGAEPQLWLGGDGFNLDTLRCFAAGGSAGRVLIQTSATQVPPDSADSVWQATATWFDLNEDGTVSVVDAGTFEEPVDANPLSFAQGNGICGARLPAQYGNG